jgi:hypothetical protein
MFLNAEEVSALNELFQQIDRYCEIEKTVTELSDTIDNVELYVRPVGPDERVWVWRTGFQQWVDYPPDFWPY